MRPIVVVAARGVGHMQVLVPVIDALRRRDRTVHVMTHVENRSDVERAGGIFFDLFGRYSLDAADATSLPIPARYVTFAGVYAESLARDVAALDPSLVIYETFSAVAPIVARSLGLPYVNVCPNHAPVPERVIAALREDPRVAISEQCHAAVERLRDVHGWSAASPFSYVDGLSPFLNVYAEPEEFLLPADRAVFEPVAFFGSLAPDLRAAGAAEIFSGRRRGARVLVSFGTVIWRYYAPAAAAALAVLCRTFADADCDVVVSLGGHDLDPAARAALAASGARVLDYLDQWAALAEADVFVTHHGINSTHEAIFHRVPMLSYPFFGDQPDLARRCLQLGVAVPLASAPRAPLDATSVRSALARVVDGDLEANLEEARRWELRTIAGRGAVIDRILALGA